MMVRVREEVSLHFQESRRTHGKARGGRIASYLTDKQRSQAGWTCLPAGRSAHQNVKLFLSEPLDALGLATFAIVGAQRAFEKRFSKPTTFLVDNVHFWIYIVYQLIREGMAMQSNVELQIGKWGNSLGIRLPKHISEVLQLRPKDKVSCLIENGKLVLEPVRPVKRYALKELLAKVEEPAEEISWGKPEGEEVW